MSNKAAKGARVPAANLPIARCCVDVPLAHLDRLFDYLIPAELDADLVPGTRVRVRFAGRLVNAFVLERAAESEVPSGKLAYVERLVSPDPVLSPELARTARAIADRYGGSLIDVLRLAIPPRHARAEAAAEKDELPPVPEAPGIEGWQRYPRGTAFAEAVRSGNPARAVWQALPGEDWPARLAELAGIVAASGRVAVLVLPDHRDVERVDKACAALVPEENTVVLAADLGPQARYRRWLAVRRGLARIVIGTRATAFAPVGEPGLLVVWDDGDDLHAEPRAPYPHVRDVLVQRAHLSRCALLVGGFARTAEAQLLVDSGWAHEILATRETVREHAARVTALGEHSGQDARDPAARAARLPLEAISVARSALQSGHPVLVQVPRRGYVPTLACQQCRAPARCRRCAGPLAGHENAPPDCRWCGAAEAHYRCPTCGSTRLRAVVIGSKRTAEEMGRAFAPFPVRTSGAGTVLATVSGQAALVVSTPGAEPVADGGYGAVLLLDAWASLGRADLRASEETLRRWMTAAALARPGSTGGRVMVMAESGIPTVQALVRWDPVWHARAELAARTELGFPPAVRMASVDGVPSAVAEVLDTARVPESAEILGPVELPGTERERALIRVPRTHGPALAAALHEAMAGRTARKERDTVRIQLDPLELV
ncbi:primosomal protein N' [Sciscionella sediminilitoris]|uniref:primosomal protein N' n=1 Tax=Sciscionella sediminilitoris TaxID=1445613 RepID=UPI0009EC21DF|nr:primosomal protein N' [Sciscionella sp. SE31]